jgi:hypothetical protein
MKRSGPIKADPDKVKAWTLKSRKKLPAESAKRKATRGTRRSVVTATIERAGGRCEARMLLPMIACQGDLEVHERHQRSIRPGSELDLNDTMALCHRHHAWVSDHVLEAHTLGLLKHSWED